MDKMLDNFEIPANQPLYLYRQPMFMLTVSVVLIEENGVILVPADADDSLSIYRFPGGLVKAGQETIQFSAVRQVKEQTGIVLQKDALIPVDFRSSPERSKEGNIVDIGMVCVLSDTNRAENHQATWVEVDFENRKIEETKKLPLYMDHELLLSRALDIALMMKE
jgi:ADP-ribose pyrophosphatase YjhB (NUDIX family)